VYGCLDVPLSALGERHAARGAALLASRPLDLVVSSGLERAEWGAALLREPRGLARRDEPDLRELERGEWAGLSFAELAERHPGEWEAWWRDPVHRRPPGGESLADLARRTLPRLEALAGEVPGGEIAVVAHAWVIRCAVCRSLSLPLELAPNLDLPPGGLVALDWPLQGASEAEPRSAAHPVLVGFNLDRAPDRTPSGASPRIEI
jgi:broad specificity phosphatase PhoE